MTENILEILLTTAGVGVFLFLVVAHAHEKEKREKAEFFERKAWKAYREEYHRNRDND